MESALSHNNATSMREVKDTLQRFEERIRTLEEREEKLLTRIQSLEGELFVLREKNDKKEAPFTLVDEPMTQGVPAPSSTMGTLSDLLQQQSVFIEEVVLAPASVEKTEDESVVRGLLDDSGKFKYPLLLRFAQEHGEAAFVKMMRHPALVGSALFRGEVVQKENSPDSTLIYQSFKPAQKLEQSRVQMEIFERSIYPLVQKEGLFSHERPKHLFTIGRIVGNDITMPDPSISKHQAEIRITFKELGEYLYHLRDLGSTNGVTLNGKRLQAFEVAALGIGDEIKLGRFFFFFSHPSQIWQKLMDGKTPATGG